MAISVTFVVLCFLFSAPFWYLMARLPSGSDTTLISFANMWCPALAAILARLIHRRNLKGFGFTLGKARWLALALLLPALGGLVMYGSAWLLDIAPLNESRIPKLFSLTFIPLFLGLLGLISLAALGEELGWRGLLVPELSRRMGYTKLSFVSGILWTLWHLPLMLFGSDHGTGSLWISLAFFSVFIMASSFVHVWMRLVSGSVLVSALLHGSSNYFIQVFYPTLTIRTPEGDAMLGEFGWFAPFIGGVIAVVFWRFRSRVPGIAGDRENAKPVATPTSGKARGRGIVWCALGLLVAALYVIPNPSVRPALNQVPPVGTSQGEVRFVSVEPNVSLEVIDFGGSGRPLVLLAGLGGTAHGFAGFSTKLTSRFHVYGITRRGFGASSVPSGGYTAKRLGEDVVSVIDALGLVRPILVGHSFGGAELSSVAWHYPEKASALIYLDAGYGYALYDEVHGNRAMTISSVLKWVVPVLPPVFRGPRLSILAGQEKFTHIPLPVLAFFAIPHDLSAKFSGHPSERQKAEEVDALRTGRQADAFERQVPSAKVVRLPRASHMIYKSNEAEVLDEMESFIRRLSP